VGRAPVAAVVAAALLLAAPAPAAPPEYPVNLIGVQELRTHLERGVRADVIDVRRWDAYVKQHIAGARSMPLRSVADRAHEISRTGLVVFY
jgi:hypothetical protein